MERKSTEAPAMITLYGMPDSGNCYKPRLLCALIDQPFQHIHVSTQDGGTASPDYRAMNPNGKVPLLQTEDGRFLPESNAILYYLGEGSPYVPRNPFDRAEMLAWMFFEQYSHEPAVAVRRSLMIYPDRKSDATPERLRSTLEGGTKALDVMEQRLLTSEWLAGGTASIADICLYAYTHCADEGGFDLAGFPGIQSWLRRVEDLPGFRPINWLPGT